METKIERVDEEHIDIEAIRRAGEILRQGGLVAFPTETVYGLGADALRPEASKKIYEAKGRPSDNPLIVHICQWEALSEIVMRVPKEAERLAKEFWPGPLTMILNKNERVPYETTGGMETVAIRMPSNQIALRLIEAGGGFIAAPSANTSGRPSPTLAEHVYEDLQGRIPLILDGGPVGIGIESTIVDLTEEVPTILRPGYVTREMLAGVLDDGIRIDPGLIAETSSQKPKAPGMKYRHYAPKAEMVLIEGKIENVITKINELTQEQLKSGKKVGIIATSSTYERYNKQGVILNVGDRTEEETVAHNLYKILREMDESGVDIIYSESFSNQAIGQAIQNRMRKAAGQRILKV